MTVQAEIRRILGRDLDPAEALAELAPRLAAKVEHIRRRSVEAPLSVARLWRNDAAPMDQWRQVVQGLMGPVLVAQGGNRSGKTHGQIDADTCTALGRYHPHTQAWCRLNGVDPNLFPVGPQDVIVISPSASSSRRDIRPAVAARLPPGAEWYGQNGLAEAYVRISVPGYHRQATIWFKSVDQGHMAFRGSQAALYHFDEEPEGPEGRLVFEEALRGAAGVGGKVVITATPQAGLTWVVEDLVMGKRYGAVTTRIDSVHNVFAPDPAALRAWLESMDDEERAMRQRGEWVDRRGAIYPQWSRGAHYVPAADALRGMAVDGEPLTAIPAHWPRFRGIDFGQEAPTAIVWGALAPDGTIHIYRCKRASGVPYEEWADVIHETEGATRDEGGTWTGHTEEVELCWGDPSSPEAIATLTLRDVPTHRAHREVDAGISAVRDAMRFRVDGRPGLYVHSDGEGTAMLVQEIEGYRWDPAAKIPRPLKVRDHLADALRYLVRGVQVYGTPPVLVADG